MASECNEEHPQVQVAPSVSEEPVSKPPSHPSPDPKVDSEQVSDGPDDRALGQDPGSQESLPPEEPNQSVTSEEGHENLLGLSFPRKLWVIVESDAFRSVHWSGEGDTVVIEADLFQSEVLGRRGAERIFETDSLKSFIRQLNLYGFSKIRPKDSGVHSRVNKRTMIYRNSNFQKDKPGLLENICKKGQRRNSARRATCAPTPKRKKLVATRHSPRFHRFHREVGAEEALPQREAPDDQGPRGTQPFMLSGVWAMGNASDLPPENQAPQEPRGPSGEGTSGNDTSVPQATAGMEGEGEVPGSPPGFPDYCSVMSLYNTCYSILLAALSAMSPREPFDDEEEEEVQ
uniref:HSF-type DNA-binding domain-containing protein n=1 Tax=Sciurus vulgaris TaxID=55149 RepID=A0A8D2DTT8_SCIVU